MVIVAGQGSKKVEAIDHLSGPHGKGIELFLPHSIG